MTSKDYVAIAAVLSAKLGDSTRADLARDLADVFAAGNARFDRARFLAACRVGVER